MYLREVGIGDFLDQLWCPNAAVFADGVQPEYSLYSRNCDCEAIHRVSLVRPGAV